MEESNKPKKIGNLDYLGSKSYFKTAEGKWSMAFSYAEDEVESKKSYELKSKLMKIVIGKITIILLKDGRQRIVIDYNKILYATRPRPDGFVGLQTFFGEDTRTSDDLKDDPAVNLFKDQKGYEPERTTTDEADWNNEEGLFIMKETK